MSSSGYYKHFMKHSNETVRCPECFESVTLQDYAKDHVAKVHDMTLNGQCVYCSGTVRWSRRDFSHLLPCLKQFLKDYKVRDLKERVQTQRVVEPCKECKNFKSVPRQMSGRRVKDRTSEYVSMYDSVFEKPDPSEILFSEKSGLREVYGIVKRYEKGDMQWCHLMVRHQNWHNFVNAMMEIKDQIILLPFWCLCDGLTAHRDTHRHMIIAYEPESGFEELWRDRVKCPLPGNGKSKQCVRIKDTYHLVRTIYYVSQPRSSCDGQTISENWSMDDRLSHFYINRPVCNHAIVYMCTMFEGGMEQLLSEQLKRRNVVDWLQCVVPTRDVNGHLKYAVPIGVTGFKFLNCVLPLDKRFEPAEKSTELYLTWLGDKKMYLTMNKSLLRLSHDEWYEHQMRKGNWVGCLSDELYVLGHTQQNVMNQIKEVRMNCENEIMTHFESRFRKFKENKEETKRMKEWIERERQLHEDVMNRERRLSEDLLKKERQLNEDLMLKMEQKMNEEMIKRERQMNEIQNLKWKISTFKNNACEVCSKLT